MKKASTQDAFLAEYLKKKSLKVTEGRKKVLRILMTENAPLPIEKIKSKIGASLDTATVYRILERFAEEGLVNRTDFRDGKAYFEYQHDHHHHITCVRCGKREGIKVCLEKNLQKVASRSKQFEKIESHMLEFFGICRRCYR